MKKLLITGASGQVGSALVQKLFEEPIDWLSVRLGERKTDNSLNEFSKKAQFETVYFDFENSSSYENALKGCEFLFLLRPPQLTDIDNVFRPFLQSAKKQGVSKIIFLSVQGAERSKIIPHRKIELLIIQLGFDYIFLRPGYFMQNLTSTLKQDIIERRIILLPAGRTEFNWTDVEDIADVGRAVIEKFETHKNSAPEITGPDKHHFYKISELIKKISGADIDYKAKNPLSFTIIKLREGLSFNYIMVLIMLHYLPRFQKKVQLSDFYRNLMGKDPRGIEEFLERNKGFFRMDRQMKPK